MLRISKLADYAVVIMHAMTFKKQERKTAKTLSEITHIKEPTVAKILKKLAHHDLLESQRGPQGGYRLKTGNINLAEIIAAIDGEIALTACNQKNACCAIESYCHLGSHWRGVGLHLQQVLSNLSLTDLKKNIL